jgi:hypothetical protein
MNLFFYLYTFILNYSFILILSDHIFFVLCFIKTQPFVKRKPVKTKKKNTGRIAFRFTQVLLYIDKTGWTFVDVRLPCGVESKVDGARPHCYYRQQYLLLLRPLVYLPWSWRHDGLLHAIHSIWFLCSDVMSLALRSSQIDLWPSANKQR